MDANVNLVTLSFFGEVWVSGLCFPVEFLKSSAYSFITR